MVFLHMIPPQCVSQMYLAHLSPPFFAQRYTSEVGEVEGLRSQSLKFGESKIRRVRIIAGLLETRPLLLSLPFFSKASYSHHFLTFMWLFF